MTVHHPDIAASVDTLPSREEAEAAIRTLLRWSSASSPELDGYQEALAKVVEARPGNLSREYQADFRPDEDYKASMPDLQNGPSSLIKGAKAEIQHVGISNFRLPLAIRTKDARDLTLEASVTGSVSLAATKKGINMSRIMRSFYRHADQHFDFERIAKVLDSYLTDLESFDARIQLRFRYPMLMPSLRSGLEGYQYYDVAFEMLKTGDAITRIIHLDYVYSSTCPCSLELSEHARDVRGRIATPHSQRSVARVSVALEEGRLWIEDLVGLCRSAIVTETQVMVKREDEQAFAELNGANPIFVEDAVRLICKALAGDNRIGDFRVVASHQESLHSHDAVSILSRGETFAQNSYDPRLFETLYHLG
ncbi:MAG: GTP cyclohydrolase FolE2 [Pseudomonadota bacterium]